MKTVSFTVRNEEGLHARPAANFCQTALRFQADIQIRKPEQDDVSNAKSILSVLCLGAVKGDTVIITADGADADEAISALLAVLEKA